MPPIYNRDSDLCQLVNLGGFGLIGVFVVSVVWECWPLQLLQPQWILKFCLSLRGSASFALVGALMVMLSRQLPGSGEKVWVQLARRVRSFAIPASLGFLLLIPLQAYGLWTLGMAEAQRDQITVDQVVAASRAIAAASGEPALREAIGRLPGGATLSSAPFREPLEQVRAKLLAELNPQLRGLQQRLQLRRRERLFSALKTGSRDLLVSLLYAIPFAAIGRWSDRRYSFLSDVLELIARLPQLPRTLASLPRGWGSRIKR